MVIDMEKLSILLKWASENLKTVEEVVATGETARVRLQDGRCGLLYLDGNGMPCVSLPEAV